MKSRSVLLSLVFLFGLLFKPVMALIPDKGMPRIALGSVGKEDYGEYFRLLVEEELIKQGFNVVAVSEQSDCTLSGIVIRYNPSDSAGAVGAEGLIRLSLPNGKLVWRGSPWHYGKVQAQAEFLVKELSKAISDGKILALEIQK